ncbi:immunoglobulin domain-containing protein [Flavobacterium faecale]|uniref:Ig-like domain-containing protein n=1 Tax=Flavobacterium faecale TaxID=1355330 RepID=UPI003AAF0BB7
MDKKYFETSLKTDKPLFGIKTLFMFLFFMISSFSGITLYSQTITNFNPTNACYNSGTSVIITGNTFTGITSVAFNGTNVSSFTVDNDNQITAVLPTGATTGNITISDGFTTWNSATQFIVNSTITPSISISSNSGNSICAGTNVTFTASPTNGGTTPSYKWFIGATQVGTDSPTFSTNTLANGNQVKVEMTSNATCASPATVISNILTMTVNPVLTPSVTIEATQTVFCVGTSVTFSINTINNGGIAPSYQWKVNGSNVGSNTDTYTTSSLSNNDIVTLEVTSSEFCASPQTFTSNGIQVTANPNLPVSVSIGATTTNFCAGTNVTFTATPTNGGTTPLYQWKLNGVNVGTNSTTYSNSALSNGDVISVELTSNETCTTGNPANDGISVTVNPIPTITGTTPNSRCGIGTVSLVATASSGTINWYASASGGPSLGTGSSFDTPSISANTTYYVDATALGCTTGSRTAVLATVNPIPTITGTTPNSRCGTGTVTLGASASAGTINWYAASSGSPILGSGTSFITPSIATNTTYYVDATDIGCTTGSRTAVLATVNSIPTITGTTPNSRCGTGTVTLGATASAGTINWYAAASGGSSLGTGTSFVTPSITTNTTYYVDATDITGCTTASRTAVLATVNTIPIITGTTPNSRCGTGTVTLGATASAGTINWYAASSGGPILGSGTSFITPSIATNTTYYVDATDIGCTTGSRTAVLATVNTIPTITGTTPNSRCGTGTVTLGATASAGTINWYAAASGGSSLGTGTSFVTPSITTNTTYYVDATDIGCTTGSRTAVLATVNTIPTITGTTPNSRCGTGTVTLGATASAGTINWYAAASGGSSLGTGTSFVTPSITTNTTYYVDATDINGCTTASRTAVLATVNTIPTITGTTPNSRCGTGTVTLGASASAGTINWYAASSGGPSLGTGTSFVTPSITTSTTYYVDATDIGCTTGSRTAVLATVNPIPTITGTTPNSRCGTGTVTLGATASAGTINWYAAASGGSSLGTGTSFITPSIATNTTYYVDATAIGCTTGTRTAVLATVNPIPTITGTTPNSRCGTGTVTLGASASAGTINWYAAASGGSSLGTGNSFITPSIATNTTYYADATALGCTTGTRTAVLATVNPILTTSVSISSSDADNTICSGNSVTFTATAVNGGTTPNYQWKINGVNQGGLTTSNTFTRTNLTNGQVVTVDMTSNATCPSAATVTSNAIATTVYTGDPSNWTGGNPISAPSSVCPPGTIDISATAVANAQYYTWTLPAGFTIISGAGTNNITVSVSTGATVGNNQNITVQAFNPCGSNGSKTTRINVNTFNGVTVNQSTQSVCSNGSISVVGTLTGNAATGTWSAPSGTFSNIVTSGTNPITVSATYTPTITTGSVTLTITTNAPSGGGCPNIPGTATVNVTVNEIVTITSQPTNNQTICSGTSASFSVAATGTGLTYQWRKGTTNLTNTGNITGATTATLNLSNVSTSDAGSYNVIVNGASPCSSVTSNNATLVVNQAIAITTQPVSTQTVCSGNSVNFSTTATGDGLTYQWRKGTTNLTNGGSITGANTNTLTINSVTSVDAATDYNVVVSGIAPCNLLTSNNAALIVNDAVAITSQPIASQTACSGNTVNFSVTATGTGLTYQWRKGLTNLSNGGNISGANTNTLTLNNLATTDAGSYNVIISGSSPCSPVTSSNSTLVVNQIVAINTQPTASQTKCTGNSATISVTATGTGLTYQWRKGTTPLSNGGTISGATTNTLTINPVTSSDAAADYNVVITGTAPCSALTSNNAALIVNDAVVITSQPIASQTACSTDSANFSVTATGTGLTYQWRKGATNLADGGNISGATTNTLTLNNLATSDAGSYNVIVTGSSPCSPVTSSNSTLVVNQIVAINTQPTASQTKCTENSATISVTATGTGLTYQWRKGTTNLSNGGAISGATTNTLTINPVTSSDAAADYNVVITGTAPCSALTSNNAALIVNDAVVITSQPIASQTACSTDTANFSITATGTGLTYQWRKGTTNLSDGGNISGATTNTLTLNNLATSDAGSYNVIVTGSSPCSPVTSSSSILVVNQIVAISTQPTVSQTKCTGNSATISVTATGTGLTYQWRKGTTNLSNGGAISGATTNTLTINPVTSSDAAADYNVVITGTAPCSALTSNNAALIVNDAVVITSQPIASQTACSTDTANFSITATGTGLTYQWRKGTTNLSDGGNISGATTNTLTLNNLATSDAGSYNVIVTGSSPCSPVTSSSSILVVNQIVAISTQPTVSQTKCTGNSATISVTATGTGLTYQWRKGTTNLSNGGTISGATTNTLTINPLVSTDAAADYNVVITGTAPCSALTSNNAALIVNDAVVITSQPIASQTACSTDTANFSVTATGTGLTYQWRKGTTNLADSGNISGANTNTLTLTNLSIADAGSYNVIVTGTSPCSPVTSNSSVLSINKKVAIGTQPSNVGICASSPAQFGVVASGDGLSYQWYKGTFPGTAVTNNAFITGAQSNILKFSQAFLTDEGIYYVIVSGASPCSSVTSNEVTLNVDQSIVITTQPSSKSLCIDSNVTFTIEADANGDPLTFQWRKNGTNIGGLITSTATTSTLTLNNISSGDAGNYDVVISGPIGYTCSSVTSTSSVLTVNPYPTISGNLSICGGFTTQLAGSASPAAANPWISSNTSVATISNTGLVSGLTSGTSTITYTNSNGCMTTATVTVTETAQVNQPTSQVVCNGNSTSNINFSTTNTSGTTTYSWTNDTASIGLASSGTGNILAFTASNLGTSPVTATIIVTPIYTNGGANCNGPTKTFTITVNPSTQVNEPTSQVVCNGSLTTLVSFATNNTGGTTTYSWTNDNTSIGLAASGSTNISAFTSVNSGTTPIIATITVTPTFNNGSVNCTGAAKTFTITVNPTAQVNQPVNQVVCNSGSTNLVSFGTNNTGGTTTYSWTNDNTSIGLAASGNSDISAFTAVNSGTTPVIATITVTPTFNNGSLNCSGPTKTFTITVNPSAQVNQPANQVVCNSGSTSLVTFGTNNTGGTTTYSWTNSNTSIGLAASGSADISSFTATNSGTTPVTAIIVVTPTFNNGSVTCTGPTKTFTITVNPTAQVNQLTNQVVCNGSSSTLVSFATNNTGGTTTYSWTNDNTSIGLAASGTGNIAAFSATNSGTSPIIATITVTPTFNNGSINCTGPTKTFTITVNPTAQVNQPTSQVVCNGSSTSLVAFGTNNTGGTTTYSWTNSNTSIGLAASGTGNIAAFSAINSGTTPVVATIVVTPTFNNGSVNCTGPTKTFTITVNPTAQVNQPTSQVVCNGSSTTLVSFGTNNTGGTTTYSWTNDNSSIGLAASGTGNIAAFSATNSGTSPIIATITVTPTFNNGSVNCTGPTKTFTITVNPTAQVNQPTSQVVCNGSSTSLVAFGTNNTGGTTTYSWTNSNTSIGLAASGTGNIAAFSAINSGTTPVVATIVVTPTFNNGSVNCTGATKTFTITVNPTAQVNQPTNQVVCNGNLTTLVTFGTTNTGGTTTYAWTNNNTSIGLGASGSSDISAFTATNSGTSPIIATITVTPTFNNGSVTCTGTTKTFTITVNPTAQVNQPTNQVVCSGTSTLVSFGTNNTGGTTTYSWTNSNTSIGLAASGTGNIASFIATNTGTSPVIATIVVTPNFNNGSVNCTGPTKTFTITVDPVSVGGNLTGYATDQSGNPYNNPIVYSKNLIACESTDGLIVLNGQVGTIIRWEYSTNGGANWTTISNTTNSHAYSSIPQTRIYRAVIQSGICSVAYSNIVTVSVVPQDIKPTPVTVSKTTMCLGDTTVFTATSGFATGQNIQGGDFNTGQFPDKTNPDKWRLDGVAVGNAWTASADNTKPNNWAGTNGHPFGTYPIFYDSLDKKFAIANGDLLNTYYGGTRDNTTLETPRFNTYGLTTSVFEVDMAWNLEVNDYGKIELSLDGGVTYNIVLFSKIGKTASAIFNPLQKFSFDLSDYVGQQDLRVKFTFKGTTVNSAWALDNIKLPTPPVGPDIVWTDENQNIISTATTYSETPTTPGIHNFAVTSFVNGCVYDITPQNTVYITVNVNYSYAGKDQTILVGECGNNSVSLNSYDNTKTANENIAKGAFDNNYQPGNHLGTGATGKWTIKSTTSTCGTGTFSNDTDPNATFTGEAGVYVLTWTTGGCTDDVQITFTNCDVIDFDGVNDNVTFKDNYNLTNKFSIEAWVKPNSVSGTQTIFSKRNANNLATGYDLKLTGNIVSFNWNNAGSITSNYPISTNRWYHIAVTFDGGIYRLFIDGIEVSNPSGVAGVKPTINTMDCILGAMDQTGTPPNKPVNYFHGWIDELRIWNTDLNLDQLHQMMNQEIISSPTVAGNVQGAIIPIDVYGLLWTTNLLGYYQMNNISCGYLNPNKGTTKGKLRNITTAEDQTAPIPYTTIRNGNWKNRTAGVTPWLHGSTVWDYPNSTGVNGDPIDWNIVVNSNNLNNDDNDITLLGFVMHTGTQLDVHAPGTLNETNSGHMLWITHYLKLNGFIDLIGESQLLQKRYYSFPTQFSESIFEEASTGYIERDQQGKKNSFNYNYWTSPVSIRGNANNSPYTLNGVLRDGTTSSNPKVIQFDGNAFYADGPVESPIKISTRWVWSYNSKTLASNSELDNYYLWNHIYNYGSLNTGEGFTMKGTGGTAPLTSTQNYVFTGKPNSGTITLGLPYEQTYLVGNPYPSALDADEFIKDNLKDCSGCRATVNTFNGALYFWDHLGITGNHNLAEYEGGYATYTLIGGTIATVDGDLNSQSGNTGTKTPARYIPVAQGFFVDAYLEPSIIGTTNTVQGGPLVFKNSQRAFMREGNPNSVFMKPTASGKTTIKANTDTRAKIRLGYLSTSGKYRQLLIGSDNNTTSNFDLGYDAPMFDLNIDDLYWIINDSPFVIQGIPDFDKNSIVPLGMTVTNEGESKIKIDNLENISNEIAIYIHDNVTNLYHDLRANDFTISLPAGKYTDRFSLRFENKTIVNTEDKEIKEGITVYFSEESYSININNYIYNDIVKKVTLFNSLGQIIKSWGIEKTNQETIVLPLKKVSSGVYIVKTKTSHSSLDTKVIIK